MKTLVLAVALLAALAAGSQLLNATPQDDGGYEPPPLSEQHRFLQAGVGEWDAVVTFTGEMGEMEMSGVETVEMFGPYYQVANFTSDYQGAPFIGRATTSYDPIREEWVSTWIDNFTPSMQVMRGQQDAESKTLTFQFMAPNEMDELKQSKTVIAFQGADAHTYEAFWIEADGSETKHMNIAYKRKQRDGGGMR